MSYGTLVVVSSVLILPQTKQEKGTGHQETSYSMSTIAWSLSLQRWVVCCSLTLLNCSYALALMSAASCTYEGHCQRNWMYSMSALQVTDLLWWPDGQKQPHFWVKSSTLTRLIHTLELGNKDSVDHAAGLSDFLKTAADFKSHRLASFLNGDFQLWVKESQHSAEKVHHQSRRFSKSDI